jgi:CheY-like chemotaxis protein
MSHNLSCLLIDDDQDDQEIFLLAVANTKLQVSCETVNNGREGLDKILNSEKLPDFVFLDLNMPHMDGKKCLEEIRKIDRLKDLPVIIYSTSSYINDIRETRRMGATGFITKPSKVNDLVVILTKIFEKKFVFFSSAYYQ